MLTTQITKAIQSLSRPVLLDDTVLAQFVRELSLALVCADVNVLLVKDITEKIKRTTFPAGANKCKWILKLLTAELISIFGGTLPSAGHPSPKTGKPKIVLMVGLNGAGKTTTCVKYAFYYKRKGLKTAVIGADTFRAGAFDQLKQNAMQARIPFYGSYTERDPVVVARAGVKELCSSSKVNLIVIDSAGRSANDDALFEEMKELASELAPHEVIYIVDGSIGQSAKEQALAFGRAVSISSVIVTKMDGTNPKGGGALTSVAAMKARVSFLGTGEHLHQLEVFDAKRFVSRLLGRGDLEGLMDHVLLDEMEKSSLSQKLKLEKKKGVIFTFRDLYEQIKMVMAMPVSDMMKMMPGMEGKGSSVLSQENLKRCLICMDSMNRQELDGDSKIFYTQPQRIQRICRGSGSDVKQVEALLNLYKIFAKMMTQMKGNPQLRHMMQSKQQPQSIEEVQNLLNAGRGRGRRRRTSSH